MTIRSNKLSALEVAVKEIQKVIHSQSFHMIVPAEAATILESILSDFEKEIKRETVERCKAVVKGWDFAAPVLKDLDVEFADIQEESEKNNK